ncbi:hypothetical protein [Salmonella enterica]|uniref:hypothetical protein n=1 Tax=Salmonella enterica TaxID=28901 RepID=UPI00398C4836
MVMKGTQEEALFTAAGAAAPQAQAGGLSGAVALVCIHRQQQGGGEVGAVKSPAAVSSPNAAVADGSDNWETF